MEEIRVLLVDDEEEFTAALAERLSMRGIPTLTCSGGEEALRIIEACPPQVVLLDMMMPGLGGKEIHALIRSKYPGIFVIFLTGHGGIESDPQCKDYLMKPVNIDEVIRKIRSICEENRSEQR